MFPDPFFLSITFFSIAQENIPFNDSICHKGSKENLIGASPSKEMVQLFSNEMQVSAETPEAFIVHASDDKTVNVLNSIYYYEALLKNKVSAEMHIYKAGDMDLD